MTLNYVFIVFLPPLLGTYKYTYCQRTLQRAQDTVGNLTEMFSVQSTDQHFLVVCSFKVQYIFVKCLPFITLPSYDF